MTRRVPRVRTPRRATTTRRAPPLLGALLGAALLGGCTSQPPSSTPASAPTLSASVSAATTPAASPGATVTITPQPALALPAPERQDPRKVRFSVTPKVKPDGNGELDVRVENLGGTQIDEIVLRWPTELRGTLYLAPFTPTENRVREGGRPLHDAWTKWVDGPGELGEPAGTTSLGWGPLQPHATLSIRLIVTRRAPGPVAFELQLLAGVAHVAPVAPGGDALLTGPDGRPAEARVEVP